MKSRREITVSSLGPAPLTLGAGEALPQGQAAVDRMIRHWRDRLDEVLPDRPDLIVVPEACDRYPQHSMAERKEYYTFRGDRIRDFFAAVAAENHCYVAYSAARKLDDGSYRNSTDLIGRDGGSVGVYKKNYPVPAETTEGGILAGRDATVFDTDFGRVGMLICFDLNFNELLERYAALKPDLLLFSSMYHGGLMQRYWAYHCRSYFVGCVAGLENTIIDPVGEVTARSTNYFPRVTAAVNLDCQVVHLDGNWEKLEALRRKYGRAVQVRDPGLLGCVLVSSSHETRTSAEMVREFEIELWDEYYARSSRHRFTPGNMEP